MRAPALLLILAGPGCGRFNFDTQPPRDGTPDTAAVDPYRDLIVGDRPIAYWRLADLGSVAIDEMGNTDGTYVGTCMQDAPGAFPGNGAIKIEPTSPRCVVTFGGAFEFPGRAPFTVEAWIAPTDAFPFGHIFSRQIRDSLMPLEGYAILESPNGIYAERIVGSSSRSTTTTTVPADRFTHVAFVYTGDTISVFTDGVPGPTFPDLGSATPFDATAMIGCSIIEVNCFEGTIDEVAIYDRALPAATIAAHHAARTP